MSQSDTDKMREKTYSGDGLKHLAFILQIYQNMTWGKFRKRHRQVEMCPSLNIASVSSMPRNTNRHQSHMAPQIHLSARTASRGLGLYTWGLFRRSDAWDLVLVCSWRQVLSTVLKGHSWRSSEKNEADPDALWGHRAGISDVLVIQITAPLNSF